MAKRPTIAAETLKTALGGESSKAPACNVSIIPTVILEPKKWDKSAQPRPQSSSIRSSQSGVHTRAAAVTSAVAFAITEDDRDDDAHDDEFAMKRPVMNSFIVTKKRQGSGVSVVPPH